MLLSVKSDIIISIHTIFLNFVTVFSSTSVQLQLTLVEHTLGRGVSVFACLRHMILY